MNRTEQLKRSLDCLLSNNNAVLTLHCIVQSYPICFVEMAFKYSEHVLSLQVKRAAPRSEENAPSEEGTCLPTKMNRTPKPTEQVDIF